MMKTNNEMSYLETLQNRISGPKKKVKLTSMRIKTSNKTNQLTKASPPHETS